MLGARQIHQVQREGLDQFPPDLQDIIQAHKFVRLEDVHDLADEHPGPF
ncbi:MAG: hypothetical protein NTX83_01490 [Burkholderiales bacterium]|nr:hypothetical protein [Burkholderiales bacterium]